MAALVVEDHICFRLAERTKGPVEAERFQAVAHQFLIGLLAIVLGQVVDLREVLLALVGEVVVDYLGELWGCVSCVSCITKIYSKQELEIRG